MHRWIRRVITAALMPVYIPISGGMWLFFVAVDMRACCEEMLEEANRAADRVLAHREWLNSLTKDERNHACVAT